MLHIARKFDVAERDERNKALGHAGEERVLLYVRSALRSAGRDDLERKVRWVSEEDGDGVGYDIASFTPDDRSRLIEETVLNSVRWRFDDAIEKRSSNMMARWLSRPATGARPAPTPKRSQSARDRSISPRPRRSGSAAGSEPPGGASRSAPRSRSRCGSACAPRAGRRGTGSPRSRSVASSVPVPGIWRPDRCPRPRPVHSFCRHGVAVLVAGKAHGMAREMPDAVWIWVCGKAASMYCGKPLRPSTAAMGMSRTPYCAGR